MASTGVAALGTVWAPVLVACLTACWSSILRSTFLFFCTVFLVRVWRSASAAQRHLVLTIACGGALLTPCLRLVMPIRTIVLPVVPTWFTAGSSISIERPAVPQAPFKIHLAQHAPAMLQRGTSSDAAIPGALVDSTKGAWSPYWLMSLFGFWGVGTLAVLVTFVRNQRRVQRFVRNAPPISDPRILRVLDNARHALQLSRTVVVRHHPLAVPMVWGFRTPVILVPDAARHWEESRLRHIFVHELAHVKRYDSWTQLLASLVCALYWFNPLAWITARAMCVEREQACDDHVLSVGGRPSAYAEDLLELTLMGGSQMVPLHALLLTQSSQIQTRLQAIVATTRHRTHRSRRGSLIACGVAMGVAYPILGMTPVVKSHSSKSLGTGRHPSASLDSFVVSGGIPRTMDHAAPPATDPPSAPLTQGEPMTSHHIRQTFVTAVLAAVPISGVTYKAHLPLASVQSAMGDSLRYGTRVDTNICTVTDDAGHTTACTEAQRKALDDVAADLDKKAARLSQVTAGISNGSLANTADGQKTKYWNCLYVDDAGQKSNCTNAQLNGLHDAKIKLKQALEALQSKLTDTKLEKAKERIQHADSVLNQPTSGSR
ncbi:MAG TPA: M56 family metallopeptidase [Gemmatimonadaceae bacterium]|jgi:beta-lactamase regulating signal transducer with metallopeptidase domain|nr:M56 family metallopeptidase [Gemmatimonadaceae bacterium]